MSIRGSDNKNEDVEEGGNTRMTRGNEGECRFLGERSIRDCNFLPRLTWVILSLNLQSDLQIIGGEIIMSEK